MDKSRCQHLPNEDEVITEGGVPHYEFGIAMEVDARMFQDANAAGLVVPPVIIHKGGQSV